MGIWGKAPEGEETLRIVHVRKIYCVYKTWYQSENIDYRCYTQICVENVRLQIFCEFTNERYDVSRTRLCDPAFIVPESGTMNAGSHMGLYHLNRIAY